MYFLKVLLNESRCSEKCFRVLKRKETPIQEHSMLALSGNAADAFFLMLVPHRLCPSSPAESEIASQVLVRSSSGSSHSWGRVNSSRMRIYNHVFKCIDGYL